MTPPVESFLALPGGRARVLTWGEGPGTVVFLHGLSGVAEVWQPTVDALPSGRRHVAIDQRGHGQTFAPASGYGTREFVGDTRAAIQRLGPPVHLVGHSMGARVALLMAARFPRLLDSVAIVDIGPEASASNVAQTARGVSLRPERFGDEEEALAFAFRTRVPTELDKHIFLARLEAHPDGSLTWRASREALIETVTRHRARNYWREWRRIAIPALFIHGGASNEVSVAIADRMRKENPSVAFERYDGIGHNIPLLAPERLATSLANFWTTSAKSAT